MATKQELLEEATAKGLDVNEEMTVAQLQQALDASDGGSSENQEESPQDNSSNDTPTDDGAEPDEEEAPDEEPAEEKVEYKASSDRRLRNDSEVDPVRNGTIVSTPEQANQA